MSLIIKTRYYISKLNNNDIEEKYTKKYFIPFFLKKNQQNLLLFNFNEKRELDYSTTFILSRNQWIVKINEAIIRDYSIDDKTFILTTIDNKDANCYFK